MVSPRVVATMASAAAPSAPTRAHGPCFPIAPIDVPLQRPVLTCGPSLRLFAQNASEG